MGISRCIEDLFVTFCCCFLYGQVVVSLTHSPFPFSILLKKFQYTFCTLYHQPARYIYCKTSRRLLFMYMYNVCASKVRKSHQDQKLIIFIRRYGLRIFLYHESTLWLKHSPSTSLFLISLSQLFPFL